MFYPSLEVQQRLVEALCLAMVLVIAVTPVLWLVGAWLVRRAMTTVADEGEGASLDPFFVPEERDR